MGKHHFHESTDKFGEFSRIIYCEWCGLVVWDFNANSSTKPTIQDLQANAGKECSANPTLAQPTGKVEK